MRAPSQRKIWTGWQCTMILGTMMQNISKPSKFDDLEDVLGFLRRPQLFEIRKVHQSLWVRGRCEKEDSARHREPEHDLLFEDRGSARNNLMHFHNRRKIKQNVLRTSAFGQRLLKSISRFSRPPKHVEKCAFQDIAKPTWIFTRALLSHRKWDAPPLSISNRLLCSLNSNLPNLSGS